MQEITSDFAAAVGNTPLIRMNKLSEETGCEILGKAEFMNPGGSVKDRAALWIIREHEKSGALRPGGTVVEGTADNTGIGLAHICNARGYPCVICMPDNQSQEKVDILRALGAEVRVVPTVPYRDEMNYQKQAGRFAATLPNGVWANQFDNTANRLAHYESTGPEIWRQTSGKVDAFVSAVGTGGTLARGGAVSEGAAREHPHRAGGLHGQRALQLRHHGRSDDERGPFDHRRHRQQPRHAQLRRRARGRRRAGDGPRDGDAGVPTAARGGLVLRFQHRHQPARGGAGGAGHGPGPRRGYDALRRRSEVPIAPFQPRLAGGARTCARLGKPSIARCGLQRLRCFEYFARTRAMVDISQHERTRLLQVAQFSTNMDYVGDAMRLLREGLCPFVEQAVRRAPRSARPADFVRSNRLATARLADFVKSNRLEDKGIRHWDVALLLRFMQYMWSEMFRPVLGRSERALVSELQDWRNK